MEKTTSSAPRFYNRTNLPPRKGSPTGDEWVTTFVIDVDPETGAEYLKESGRENLYERIQESLEATKIENIIRRFEEGDPNALGHANGLYADISDMPTNIIDAHKKIQKVQTEFGRLPADIKELFGNNPTQFMAEMLSGVAQEKLKAKTVENTVESEEKHDEPKQ